MQRTETNVNLRQIIRDAIAENGGRIELEEAMELIRTHFEYDIGKLIEGALARKTRYIIYSLRDRKGVRDCFANDDGGYIDVMAITDPKEIEKIKSQIKRKINGLLRDWDKIRGREREIVGQITFDELDRLLTPDGGN